MSPISEKTSHTWLAAVASGLVTSGLGVAINLATGSNDSVWPWVVVAALTVASIVVAIYSSKASQKRGSSPSNISDTGRGRELVPDTAVTPGKGPLEASVDVTAPHLTDRPPANDDQDVSDAGPLQPVPIADVDKAARTSDSLPVHNLGSRHELIGREDFVRSLRESIRTSKQTLVLFGPAGIGKSAIVTELGYNLPAANDFMRMRHLTMSSS